MFFVKRAWYYVSRKIGKSITIGIILFVVFTLILTGLLINSGAKGAYEVARSKLGATVTYNTDLTSVMSMNTPNGGGRPNMGTGSRFEMPDDYTEITTKEIETIVENSKYVKNYTISASTSGEAKDFTYYDPFEEEEDNGPTFSFGGGGGIGIVAMNNSNVTINGVDTKTKDNTFDQSTLTDGRYFTDEEIENGDNVIIIENTIATLNDIKPGDKITITKTIMKMDGDEPTTIEVDIEYEVIGIYKTTNPTDISGNMRMMTSNLTENTMYAPYIQILKSDLLGLSEAEYNNRIKDIEENGYTVRNVTFTLKDSNDIDKFIAEVESMEGIDTTYRSFNANNEAYEKMVGPISNVASTSTILVVVIVIAGIFIIGLITMLAIKDRKYELGVLLSLGESKPKIVIQLITETLMVAILAFTLATLTSTATAQVTTNYLLKQEIASTEEENNNGFGLRPSGSFSIGGFGAPSNINVLDVETIDELTVKVNAKDVLQMAGIGTVIIVIGNLAQAMFVLKAKPKEILLER